MASDTDPTDLFSFLLTIPKDLLTDLYDDVFTVLTIFRSLPAFAKHYVMRLITLPPENGIPRDQLMACVLPHQMPYHREALFKLRQLCIIKEFQPENKQQTNKWDVRLERRFRQSLEEILTGCGGLGTNQHKDTGKLQPKKILKMNKKAQKCWETLVHFLVGSEVHGPAPKTLRDLIENVGLMESGNMTKSGFQFLYQPLHKQIWKIVVGYMKTCEKRMLVPKDVLTFLFRLAFIQPGQVMRKQSLSSTQKILVHDLFHMGIVWMKSKDDSIFMPSHLALHLSSGKLLEKSEEEKKGYIIVETTFCVYAYTSSPLQIGLLSKFCALDYRFPNLVRGKIIKEKVQKILADGISVELILSYLKDYAHPQMRNNNPIIPVNVTDQIKLWGQERYRLNMTVSHLVSGFTNHQVFSHYIKYLNERDEENVAEKLDCPESTLDVINLLDDQNVDEGLTDKIRTDEISPAVRRMLRSVPAFRSKYELILQQFSWQGIGFLRSLDSESRMQIHKRLRKLHTIKQNKSAACLIWQDDEKRMFCVTAKGKKKLDEYRSSIRRKKNQRYSRAH